MVPVSMPFCCSRPCLACLCLRDFLFAICSALDSISDTLSAHCRLWKVLQDYESEGEAIDEPQSAEEQPPDGADEPPLEKVLEQSMMEVMREVPAQRTALVYDEQMMEHHNMWDSCHPESPQRINQIFKRHKDLGLLDRCSRIPSRLATQKELQMCHSLSYIQKIEASAHMKPRDLHRLGNEYNSIYINSRSYHSARLAAGSTFSVVEAVVTGKAQNGVCIVRPPGHHAEPAEACGFCFFNTVALAARYAQRLRSRSEDPLRVMILDWDVHHGNGTQHIFQEDASVLYVSLHRYDEGLFFPNSEDASHDKVGIGKGAGFNVNIPWNGSKMGDPEYLMAFHRVVMPIAYEFNPQLVLISAGFDAARGDPLGGCQVSPEGYAHMTHLLMGLAGGRVILVLEGGYNLTSISESMVMCTHSLLGDPPPTLSDLRPPKPSAFNSVRKVRQAHRKYWRSLRLNVAPQGAHNLQHSPVRNPSQEGRFATEAGPSAMISPQGASPPNRIPSEETAIPLASPQRPDSVAETPRPLVPESRFSPEEVAGPFTDPLAAPQHVMPTEEVSPQKLTSPKGTSSQLVSNQEEPEPTATTESPGIMLHGWQHGTPKSPTSTGTQTELMGAESRADTAPERGATGEKGVTPTKQELLGEAAGGSEAGNPHIGFETLMESMANESGEGFAVTPLPWCPHLGSVSAVPPAGLDVRQLCAQCASELENWVCLTCYQVLCGRYVSQHMLCHGLASGHHLVLSFSDLSVWCYGCESYVHHQALFPAKSAAYSSKFGANSQLECSQEGSAHGTPKSPPSTGSQRVLMGELESADIAPQPEGDPLDVLSPGQRIGSGKEGKAPGPPSSTPGERSLEQILKDLQLSDHAGSNPTIAPANETHLDPVGGARRKEFISTRRDAREEEQKEGRSIQAKGVTPTKQELLGEAAGGSEAGNPHIGFETLMESMANESGEGFAVTPLPWCPHLGSVSAVPPAGLDVRQLCAQCASELENWVCLTCYQVLCGRYVSQHMLCHGLASGHHLVLSFSDLSVWCYGCESYVHHQVQRGIVGGLERVPGSLLLIALCSLSLTPRPCSRPNLLPTAPSLGRKCNRCRGC
uniref:Protein deacetylase HDAC6 n=1 Tax=Xenopus tropicalis TaxID=8364 RepID=A0A803J9G6_XENTR